MTKLFISNQLLKTREPRRGFRHVKEVRMFRYITYPISSISYSIELFPFAAKGITSHQMTEIKD